MRYENFQYANNKGADQPARMRRLVCAFVVRQPQTRLGPIIQEVMSDDVLSMDSQTTVYKLTFKQANTDNARLHLHVINVLVCNVHVLCVQFVIILTHLS